MSFARRGRLCASAGSSTRPVPCRGRFPASAGSLRPPIPPLRWPVPHSSTRRGRGRAKSFAHRGRFCASAGSPSAPGLLSARFPTAAIFRPVAEGGRRFRYGDLVHPLRKGDGDFVHPRRKGTNDLIRRRGPDGRPGPGFRPTPLRRRYPRRLPPPSFCRRFAASPRGHASPAPPLGCSGSRLAPPRRGSAGPGRPRRDRSPRAP